MSFSLASLWTRRDKEPSHPLNYSTPTGMCILTTTPYVVHARYTRATISATTIHSRQAMSVCALQLRCAHAYQNVLCLPRTLQFSYAPFGFTPGRPLAQGTYDQQLLLFCPTNGHLPQSTIPFSTGLQAQNPSPPARARPKPRRTPQPLANPPRHPPAPQPAPHPPAPAHPP